MVKVDIDPTSDRLDAALEKRAYERKVANEEAAAWRASARAHTLKAEFARAQAWREYHLHLAAVHERLAAENRQKAIELAGGSV